LLGAHSSSTLLKPRTALAAFITKQNPESVMRTDHFPAWYFFVALVLHEKKLIQLVSYEGKSKQRY
jgi:hypothetical protein